MKFKKQLLNKLFLIFIFIFFQSSAKTKTLESIKIDSEKEIVLGQSIYHSGAFKLYGDFIKAGILAHFNKVNDEGGINGKKLKLISLDDKGSPIIAEKNVKYLNEKYGIDMFFGNMGTRSILKTLPMIENEKIAMLFPWGGDEKLRNPKLKNIINGPGLIQPQIEALVNFIVKTIGFTEKISIFYADDNFSINNKNDTEIELKNHGIIPSSSSSYNRFTMNIAAPTQSLLTADPRAVICLSTSHPTAKLISNFFENGAFGTTFVGIDSTFLVGNLLKERGAVFYYSSAVPDPYDANLKIVEQYQKDLKKYFPNETYNILSLTYYICAKILTEAIKEIPDKITKEKIINKIESMKNYNLENFTINFNSQNRHIIGNNISIIKG